jgi:plastocyanin
MRWLVAIGVVLGLAAPARAGDVSGTVVVKDTAGNVVSAKGAVVYVVGFDEEPPAAKVTITQKDRRFVPDLVTITAGQTVDFPNGDPFVHNVFSLSPARKFDLGSYRKGKSKSKSFPKTGVVDVYCNIHPQMAATILVVPNRRHARAGKDGRFTIAGVPKGRWKIFAYVRNAAKPVSVTVEVTDDGATGVTLELVQEKSRAHPNKYGEEYRDEKRYR